MTKTSQRINSSELFKEFEPFEEQTPFLLPDVERWVDRCKKHYDLMHEQYPGWEYRPYQYEYAALYSWRDLNICAGVPGVGKTCITALAIAAIYHPLQRRRPGTIQIAVPNALSATSRWLVDLNKLAALQGKAEFINSEKQLLNSKAIIWIYTHDFLKRKARSYPNPKRAFISRLIVKKMKAAPSFLIVDEGHRLLKGSERTKHFEYLRPKVKRFLMLSGTISDGRLGLICSACDLTYQKLWPWYKDEKEFARTFGVKKLIETNYATGEDNNNEGLIKVQTRYLQNLAANKSADYYWTMRSYVHRVRMQDPNVRLVVKLPKDRKDSRKLDMEDWHSSFYFNCVRAQSSAMNLITEVERPSAMQRGAAFRIISPLFRASDAPSLLNADLTLPTIKMKELVSLVKEANDKGVKSVVFVHHIHAARAATKILKAAFSEEQILRLYSQDDNENPKKMGDDAREEVISRLNFDDSIIAGVCSVNLAGESIDLTGVSRVIFFDLPWQSIKIHQAIDRCIRPGQVSEEVEVFFLAHRNTIDEHALNLLVEKSTAAKKLLDYDFAEMSEEDLGTLDPIAAIRQIMQSLAERE